MDGLDGEVDQDLEPSETRSAGSGSAGGGSRTSSPEMPAGKSSEANPPAGEQLAAPSSEPSAALTAAPSTAAPSAPATSTATAAAATAALPNGVASSDGTPDEKERSGSPSPPLSLVGPRPGSFDPPGVKSDDLPPMVKLEPDFNPVSSSSTSNEDVKSRPPALLSPSLREEKAAASTEAGKAAWVGKQEEMPVSSSPKLPSPTTSSCPPPLDMSIAAADAANAALRNANSSASSGAGLHSSPFVVPPAHSGFVRPYAPLEPNSADVAPYSVLAGPPPPPPNASGAPLALGPLPPTMGPRDLPEQSEPHNLKIKQEMVDPTAAAINASLRDMSSIPRDPNALPSMGSGFVAYPPTVVPVASLMEPKREPGLTHPHPTAASPRLEKSSGSGASSSNNNNGSSKSSPAIKKASTPTPQQQPPTQPQQSSQPPAPPPPAHSLPYPPHFLPHGLGLGPPQGLPLSPYHQPGAHAYSPYYPYPFAYHYPPMRMHAPPPPASSGPRPQSPPSFVVVSSGSGGFPPVSVANYHQSALSLGNFHTSPSGGINPFAPNVSGGNVSGNGSSMHPSPPVTSAASASSSSSSSSSSSGHGGSSGRPYSNKGGPSDPSQMASQSSRSRSPPPSSSSAMANAGQPKRAPSPPSKRPHHLPSGSAGGMPAAHSMTMSSASPYLPIFSSAASTSGGLGSGYPPTSAGSMPTYSGVGPGPFGFGNPSLAELQAKSESPWNHHPHHPHSLPLPLSHPHHHLQPRSSTPIQPVASTSTLSHSAAGLSLAPVSPTVGNHLMPGLVPPPTASSSSAAAAAMAASHDEGNNTMHEDMEEEAPSPVASSIPRGPSPEPRIEDSECHRSQSAM